MEEKAPIPSAIMIHSKDDNPHVCELQKHFGSLIRNKKLELWSDLELKGGDHWEERIFEEIENASIAFLFISANFLNTDYIFQKEIPYLLERNSKDGLHIIPIFVSSCSMIGEEWINSFQHFPKNGYFLNDLSDSERDKVYTDIVKRTNEIIDTPPPLPPKETIKLINKYFSRCKSKASAESPLISYKSNWKLFHDIWKTNSAYYFPSFEILDGKNESLLKSYFNAPQDLYFYPANVSAEVEFTLDKEDKLETTFSKKPNWEFFVDIKGYTPIIGTPGGGKISALRHIKLIQNELGYEFNTKNEDLTSDEINFTSGSLDTSLFVIGGRIKNSFSNAIMRNKSPYFLIGLPRFIKTTDNKFEYFLKPESKDSNILLNRNMQVFDEFLTTLNIQKIKSKSSEPLNDLPLKRANCSGATRKIQSSIPEFYYQIIERLIGSLTSGVVILRKQEAIGLHDKNNILLKRTEQKKKQDTNKRWLILSSQSDIELKDHCIEMTNEYNLISKKRLEHYLMNAHFIFFLGNQNNCSLLDTVNQIIHEWVEKNQPSNNCSWESLLELPLDILHLSKNDLMGGGCKAEVLSDWNNIQKEFDRLIKKWMESRKEPSDDAGELSSQYWTLSGQGLRKEMITALSKTKILHDGNNEGRKREQYKETRGEVSNIKVSQYVIPYLSINEKDDIDESKTIQLSLDGVNF